MQNFVCNVYSYFGFDLQKNLLLSQSDIFGAFLCTEIARNIANLGLRIENVNFIYSPIYVDCTEWNNNNNLQLFQFRFFGDLCPKYKD